MVPTEGAFLAEFLAGTHDPSLADTMLIGRIDGTIVGTAWHGTDRDLPEMGGYGFVFTDPAQRGKGVAQRLTELAIQGFWSAGGQVSYLGTMNPVAQHVYEKHGFCPYNGLTMRALRPGTKPDGFDDRFFSRAGAGEIRDIRMGDLAAYTGLLMLPEPREWIVRDYTEAILYAPPTVEAGGCLRPFLQLDDAAHHDPGQRLEGADQRSRTDGGLGQSVGAHSRAGARQRDAGLPGGAGLRGPRERRDRSGLGSRRRPRRACDSCLRLR